MKSYFVYFIKMIRKIFNRFFGIIFDSEILHIIRPFIYVYLVMKHGKKSWIPLQVSFALDAFIIFLVGCKLFGKEKLRNIERRDLIRRSMWSLVMYLIRDPIFDSFTLKII